jgi:hypothetical protein
MPAGMGYGNGYEKKKLCWDPTPEVGSQSGEVSQPGEEPFIRWQTTVQNLVTILMSLVTIKADESLTASLHWVVA